MSQQQFSLHILFSDPTLAPFFPISIPPLFPFRKKKIGLSEILIKDSVTSCIKSKQIHW